VNAPSNLPPGVSVMDAHVNPYAEKRAKPCRCDAYKFPHRWMGGACEGGYAPDEPEYPESNGTDHELAREAHDDRQRALAADVRRGA